MTLMSLSCADVWDIQRVVIPRPAMQMLARIFFVLMFLAITNGLTPGLTKKAENVLVSQSDSEAAP